MIETVSLNQHGILEASAGTGKTYSLVELVLRVLEDSYSHQKNISLKNILLLTFTNKAILELKNRLKIKLYERFENEIEVEKKEFFFNCLTEFEDFPIYTLDKFFYKSIYILDTYKLFIQENLDINGIENSLYLGLAKKYFIELNKGTVYGLWNNLEQEYIDLLIHISDPYKKDWDNIFFNTGLNFSQPKKELLLSVIKKYEKIYTYNGDIYESKLSISILDSNSIKELFLELEQEWQSIYNIDLAAFYNFSNRPNELFRFLQSILKKYSTNINKYEFFKDILEISLKDLNDIENTKSKKYQNGIHNFEKIFFSIKKVCSIINTLKIQVLLYLALEVLKDVLENNPLKYGYYGRKILSNRLAYTKKTSYSPIHYVFIDEFQDTNLLEWETLKSILYYGGELPCIFIIGDPKQAIYQFKGSDFVTYDKAKQELLALGGKMYILNKNYRTGTALLESLNQFFLSLWPSKYTQNIATKNIDSSMNIITLDEKNIAESNIDKYIESIIPYLVDDLQQNKDTSIAILARDNKTLEKCTILLKKHKLPYFWYGQKGIFNSIQADQIALIFYILHFTYDPNSLYLVMNGVFFSSYKKNTHSFPKDDLILLSYMRNLGEYKKWAELRNVLLYHTSLKENTTTKDFDIYLQIINTLISYLISNSASVLELLKYIEALKTKEQENNAENKYNSNTPIENGMIQLMTIHASKGLEFDIVYVLGFNEEKIKYPYLYKTLINDEYNSLLLLTESQEYQNEIKEENSLEFLNLHYVAFTRARSKLTIPIPSNSNNRIFSLLLNLSQQGYINVLECKSIQENTLVQEKALSVENKNNWDLENFSYRTWEMVSYTSLSKKMSLGKGYNPVYFEQDKNEEYLLLPSGKETGIFLHTLLENIKWVWEKYNGDISTYIQKMMEKYSFTDVEISLFKKFLLAESTLTYQERKSILKDSIIRNFLFQSKEKLISINKLKETGNLFHNEFITIIEKIFAIILPIEKKKMQDLIFSSLSSQEVTFMFQTSQEIKNKYIESTLDMIFVGENNKIYFLDWKTDTLPNYNNNTLKQQVEDKYSLQWKIYLISLVKYLKTFFNDSSYYQYIGGFYYIFIRGIDNEESQGIFFQEAPTEDNIGDIINEINSLLQQD